MHCTNYPELFGNLGILSQMESVERKGTFRVKRASLGCFCEGYYGEYCIYQLFFVILWGEMDGGFAETNGGFRGEVVRCGRGNNVGLA